MRKAHKGYIPIVINILGFIFIVILVIGSVYSYNISNSDDSNYFLPTKEIV